MAEGLEDLMNKVSLGDVGDDIAEVFIDEDTVDEGKMFDRLCLVGKLILRKPYSIEAMRWAFIKAWQVSQNLEVQEIGDRIFLFRFQSQFERAKVFLRQPWFFNKALLVMADFNGLEQLEDHQSERCPFWVQLHGVPVGLRIKKVGWLLGNQLGDVIEVDSKGNNSVWGKWLKVQVLVHVFKPLKRGCWMNIANGNRIWITFKFEKIPDLCFVCGCLDHTEKDCVKAIAL
ncbi:hypothetical protein PTKIN_Ptkin19aG0084800 [Pterospermum kingtungense]